ncbi:MAG: nuclear transport factor 2 family protein [Bizionia sp.]|nr:nuclear transport factor 2 family protein [Bizionia sp.]
METKDVAKKWKEMCEQGKSLDCIHELYAEDITSKEMPGVPNEIVSGKKNVWNKSKQWMDNIEEFHSSNISEPIVAGNHFTATMNYDVTFKDNGRQKMEEVAVFEVKDGKIKNEQFFYSME